MIESDFIVVGAGIGGTSTAYWLSRDNRVSVLEMESQPGYHTTGRSVAMYTEAYGPRVVRALAKASFKFLTRPPADFANLPLGERSGFMFIARRDQKASLKHALQEGRALSPDIHAISSRHAVEMVPVLRPEYVDSAFLDPNTIALDVSAIHQGFMRGLKKNGARIFCDAGVVEAEKLGDSWKVVTSEATYLAPVVINAAGAWADQVGALFGAAPIGLQPKKRTVIAFAPGAGISGTERWPFVFDTDEEFYFKLDSGSVLASPADESPLPAQDVQPEDIDVALTVDRIERATTLKITSLNRKWAGLRSFVSDKIPVVGFDPGVSGFFWCAGQGGYGIETSWAMGQVAASLAAGSSIPSAIRDLDVSENDFCPQRLRSHSNTV